MVRVSDRLRQLNRAHAAAQAATLEAHDQEGAGDVDMTAAGGPYRGTQPSHLEPSLTCTSLPLAQATGTPASMPNTQWQPGPSLTQLTPNHTQRSVGSPAPRASAGELERSGHRTDGTVPFACGCGDGPMARIVLQIHDELLLEVREGHVAQVAAEVKQQMEDGRLWTEDYANKSTDRGPSYEGTLGRQQVHAPPLVVKFRTGLSWGSLKEYTAQPLPRRQAQGAGRVPT